MGTDLTETGVSGFDSEDQRTLSDWQTRYEKAMFPRQTQNHLPNTTRAPGEAEREVKRHQN